MGRATGQSRVRTDASDVLRKTAARAEIMADRIGIAVQPILDLRTGRLAGYEALARFSGNRRPDECFARAHAHGLGPMLEARAVATALALPGRPSGSYLSVNLSATALASPDVAEILPDDLTGLVIEVTEHEPLTDDPQLRAALEDIRSRGAWLAVDDAGSGYAGLKQVARLAPEIIKLDRTLVEGVHDDPVKAALIESFVRYARDLGASVCAEGVETLDELQRLAELDVGYGQGYGIGRPAPPWPSASRRSIQACAASFSETLMALPDRLTEDANDRRLEALTALLSCATSYRDLAGAMMPIAQELRADEIAFSALNGSELVTLGVSGPDISDERYAVDAYPATANVLARREVVQVLGSDPEADPNEIALLRELGFGSLLMLPVMCAGEVIGLLEAYASDERPWSRFEIRRARIITYQLGAVLERVQRTGAAGRRRTIKAVS